MRMSTSAESPIVEPKPIIKPSTPEKAPIVPIPNPFQPVKPIILPGTEPTPKA